MRYMTVGLALAVLSGCATLDDTHGYTPDETLLSDVMVGLDTKATVSRLIGPPGSTGLVDDTGWYYVSSEFERFLWREPVEVDRDVVVVRFDEAGVVSNIERFGIEAGRVVVLERRVTDSNIRGIGLLRQLFGNFGQLDAGQLFDDE